MTEFSGRRGIHVWIVFSHLIPKEKAFQILSFLKNEVLSQIGEFVNANLDLFPATNSSKGNIVGKQVKLPLSVHKSGKQSWLFQGSFRELQLENRAEFLENQFQLLKCYNVNDYETISKKIGLEEDVFIVRLKYKKYRIDNGLKLSIWKTISILEETKVYSIFPNYDVKKTIENINKYKDAYFPATFEYLYKIYGIEMEDFLDKSDIGFNYLLKENGIAPKAEEMNWMYKPKNESEICIADTIRKEKKYFLDNDEVLNVSIWNNLNSIKNQDIRYLEDVVEKILIGKRNSGVWDSQVVVYGRMESEKKIRRLVSLGALDRVLTTHISLLLQSKMKKMWNSYSYNVSFCSREDIFYNWYSSWSEYLNKIKTFLEVPFMENYEVFVVDLKGFYDHIDFLSVYATFADGLGGEEKRLFKFLIDYNDLLMRKLSDGKRKGVPQGPAYARIISEMYLDSVLSSILEKYENSIYHLYRYVDDIIVFVKPEKDSNGMYQQLVNKLLSFGLPVNEEKSGWYGTIKSLNEELKKRY